MVVVSVERLSVGLRVRGTRVVWSGETDLPSLLLCPTTRAGEISLATRGSSERNLLPLITLRNDRVCSKLQSISSSPVTRALRRLRRIYSSIHADIMTSQEFTSSLALTDAQKASLGELEPAFEHLLREVGLDESTICALRHCRINYRENASQA